VTTDAGVHEADVLVLALGADYDLDATPGLAEAGNEFYSVTGAERLAEILPTFSSGRAIVGVCGAPFKCPPAPSECALLLHDYLSARGARDACEISIVIPFGTPVPPSPETSEALRCAARSRRRPQAPRPGRRDCERHTEDGYVPVSSQTLETRFPGVYAVGDVAMIGVPKAGVFAEGAARVVAESLLATLRGGEQPGPYLGRGSCYIEFSAGRVGRVDIDFLSGRREPACSTHLRLRSWPTSKSSARAEAHAGSARPSRRRR